MKTKENEKKDKYFDLAKELRKLWNIKVTVLPVIIWVLESVCKILVRGLEQLEIRRRSETIQTATLLKSARISRKSSGDML